MTANQGSYDFRVERDASTLRHRVTEAIRDAIAVGHYGPGARMPERDLCELTGVSRTLVREALRQLESEGLVRVIPHKGPIVATMTAEQARGTYEVRGLLEALAARHFAERATDADLAAIADAFERVRTAYETGIVLERLEAKNHFYDCLVRGAGNEAIGLALHMINARTMLLRGRSLSLPDRWRQSLVELAAILDALSRRDPDEAQRYATEHVRMAAEAALSSFAEDAKG
jgi:DNA-binding GntR family transcriptional regulator